MMIIEMGFPGAILWTKTCFVAAILNLSILSGKHWSDVVVPTIFEISALKYPLGQPGSLSLRRATRDEVSPAAVRAQT